MNKDKSIAVAFSNTVAGTAAALTFGCNPAGLGNRILSMADGYEFYRLTKLEFRLLPSTTSAAASRASSMTACYLGGVTDTAPSNTQLASECVHHVYLGNSSTVPTEWCHVNRKELAGYNPWYKTVVGSPDPSTEVQGNIFVISPSGTDTYVMQLRGIVQFKGSVPTGSTPMVRQLNEMRREKERLLKILSATPGVSTTQLPKQ